ncbi:LacI family DNA-binding transcriptional regulator [Paenibacillus cremeus]|uniref:LacI family transcriptional regulator n=1 Tax=Paenibacillus cremeus TaxID=2163881 RepID=A0A559K7Q0_9BACL|nr:LacI family DNA-binding transcriptional regulator [Paenibacillus cremeus]TVY08152.1 LacI family transcriptional regulator [Paenibacillus cremeus]
MATIKDVAKRAGVALSTASCALNGDDKVKPSTRLKVLEAAKELNYQKNGFATDLKRTTTKTIAVIVEGFSGPFFSQLLKGLHEVVSQRGYDLIACSSNVGQDSTAVKYLKEKRTDGAIVLHHNISEQLISESAREGFPIIVLNRPLELDNIASVYTDDFSGGQMGADYLIGLGHTRIAFVGGSPKSQANDRRYAGFLTSLTNHGLQEQSKWNVHGDFTRIGGYQATKMLVLQGDLPTAIFYANDEMAIGALEAFKELGIQVPRDISIIGYDNSELSEFVNPTLTTLKQPKYEMGILAAHLMFQALGGEKLNHKYKLPVELIERNSCRKL